MAGFSVTIALKVSSEMRSEREVPSMCEWNFSISMRSWGALIGRFTRRRRVWSWCNDIVVSLCS